MDPTLYSAEQPEIVPYGPGACDVCGGLGTYPIIDKVGRELYDICCPECDGTGKGVGTTDTLAKHGRLIAKGKNTDFPRLSNLAMQAERQVFPHGRRAS